MEKEIIEFETMLKGFSNNERLILKELQTKDQEEIIVLLMACKNIIYEQCYNIILEKNLVKNIKEKLLRTIQKEIQALNFEQLSQAFSSKLEIYIQQEEQQIEMLEKLSKKISEYDYKTMIENIIATLLKTTPQSMEQMKERKEYITKEKLKELSYNKKPVISEDEIDNRVIAKICEHIIREGLKEIVLKVETTLENDELFLNLKAIKENSESLVSEYYIEILEKRKKNLEKYIYNSETIKKHIKNKKPLLSQLRNILDEKINKHSIFTSEQKRSEMRSLIVKIDTIYEIEQELEKRKNNTKSSRLTEQQIEMFEQTETYKEMQNRKHEDKIELSEKLFVKKIREELNQKAQEISNNLTEEAIANEQEQQKIKEFAKQLSISVQRLTKILANDDNIYLYLIANWLTYEIKTNVITEENAALTIRRISPELPPSNVQLAELMMRTMEVPPYLKEEVKEEISVAKLTNQKVKRIGKENTKKKNNRR